MKENPSSSKKTWQQVLSSADIMNFFRHSPILTSISDEGIQTLVQSCKVKYFAKGSIVFRPNDPSNWMYFVYSGHVVEFVGYGSSVDIIVKTRRSPDYIGEMGMLIDEPYANTAVAMENLTLIALSRETFLKLVWENSGVSHFIIKQLIHRLTGSAKKVISTMYLDAPGRLAFTLVALSGDMAGNHHEISVTQSDIAASAGIARQTVAKILGEWRKEGWISTLRGKIAVDDLDALLDVIVSSELK